jgi:hypothetical protein
MLARPGERKIKKPAGWPIIDIEAEIAFLQWFQQHAWVIWKVAKVLAQYHILNTEEYASELAEAIRRCAFPRFDYLGIFFAQNERCIPRQYPDSWVKLLQHCEQKAGEGSRQRKEKQMKEIGRTNDGNVLVEMSFDEARELVKLALVIEGKTLCNIQRLDLTSVSFIGPDLSKTFGAIRAFTEGKGIINEMRCYLDEMDRALTRKAERPSGDVEQK